MKIKSECLWMMAAVLPLISLCFGRNADENFSVPVSGARSDIYKLPESQIARSLQMESSAYYPPSLYNPPLGNLGPVSIFPPYGGFRPFGAGFSPTYALNRGSWNDPYAALDIERRHGFYNRGQPGFRSQPPTNYFPNSDYYYNGYRSNKGRSYLRNRSVEDEGDDPLWADKPHNNCCNKEIIAHELQRAFPAGYRAAVHELAWSDSQLPSVKEPGITAAIEGSSARQPKPYVPATDYLRGKTPPVYGLPKIASEAAAAWWSHYMNAVRHQYLPPATVGVVDQDIYYANQNNSEAMKEFHTADLNTAPSGP